MAMFRLKRQVTTEQASNQSLRERNEALRQEVLALQQDAGAIESRARSDLGMIRRGETFYHERSERSERSEKNENSAE